MIMHLLAVARMILVNFWKDLHLKVWDSVLLEKLIYKWSIARCLNK